MALHSYGRQVLGLRHNPIVTLPWGLGGLKDLHSLSFDVERLAQTLPKDVLERPPSPNRFLTTFRIYF